MPQKCLLIETSDKKKYFTYAANYNEIKTFAKAFNYKIFSVVLEKGEILNLEDLATALTSKTHCNDSKFTIIRKYPKRPKKRK